LICIHMYISLYRGAYFFLRTHIFLIVESDMS
jgi:hypothetical protein